MVYVCLRGENKSRVDQRFLLAVNTCQWCELFLEIDNLIVTTLHPPTRLKSANLDGFQFQKFKAKPNLNSPNSGTLHTNLSELFRLCFKVLSQSVTTSCFKIGKENLSLTSEKKKIVSFCPVWTAVGNLEKLDQFETSVHVVVL